MTAPPISTSPILAPPDALVSASADSPPSYSHAADPHLADHGGSNLGMTTFYQEASIRVFQPMLQVEHFSWPKACHGLEASAARELDRLTDALLGLLRQGMKVVGLGGRQPDEGATTLLLCLARRMVARNVKTVVVDADVFDPQVAKRLGLIPQLGWEDVAAGHQPVEEVLVESASDNLVVLPVCRPFDAAMLSGESRLRLADSLELLRNNYGLVLMDLGPLENSETIVNITRGKTGNMLDAAMLVQHVGKTSADHLAEVRQALSSSGVHVAGVIENFL
jgi:Mrp family chromosome partitioning ATPase